MITKQCIHRFLDAAYEFFLALVVVVTFTIACAVLILMVFP